MKTTVYDLQGKETTQVELPAQFDEEVRGDLINRAFLAQASLAYQPKGTDPRAGLKTTAEYYGRRHAWRQTINTGRSRLPREKLPGGRLGRVLRVPHAIKGRRAHPPKPEKNIIEKINLKERNKAIRSALAACILQALVTKKHIVEKKLPLVVTDDFETLKKTKDVLKVFTALGLEKDITRVEERTKRRTGVTRLRGRGKRVPRSVLVIVGKDNGISKGAGNLPGVEVTVVDKLTAKQLAPGGVPGRLTLWSANALNRLAKESLYY